jgi:hypothetical protein
MPDIITFNHLAEILGVDLNYFSEGLFPFSAKKLQPGHRKNKQMSCHPQIRRLVVTGICHAGIGWMLIFPD